MKIPSKRRDFYCLAHFKQTDGAMGETRTLKGLLPLAPKASAYTSSATMAIMYATQHSFGCRCWLSDSRQCADKGFDASDFFSERPVVPVLAVMARRSAIGLAFLIEMDAALETFGLRFHIAVEAGIPGLRKRPDETHLPVLLALKSVARAPEKGNSIIGRILDQ